ncbi:putative (S)-N-methylcoclaurine 3'-hydroxylase isozyme 2 [Vitis vinifera]|uniref:Putative (S)-N-methylcoclaurine 3'-hydroxylase isozyme 2 n=1 Tax=Vitis vinifera TaxID=29760 RepID=A0A438CZ24_VITVI|nr:putative (S)-N-methylcoclaurine 3'-hydroxylase isozyme 2 [Vitis vinifera]
MDSDTVIADISLSSFLYALLLLPFLLILKHIFLKPPPLPPGPYPWPIIGNLLQLGKNPHVKLASLAKLHGPLMSLRLGTQLMVVASSPAAAIEVLKTHDRTLSGRYVSSSLSVKDPKLNHLSLAFAKECTNNWKNLRTICRTEMFSGKAMESHVELRERKVMELVEFLATKEGEVVKVMDIVFTTICNILSNTFFSMDLCDFEREGLKDFIYRAAELGATPNLSDFYPILDGLNLHGSKKKSKEALGRILATWEGTLKKEGSKRILELFSAGADTSTLTIEWAITQLIRNPDVMYKLRDELSKIIGESPVRESHLPHLPYLQACVKRDPEIASSSTTTPSSPSHGDMPSHGLHNSKRLPSIVNIWAMGRDPKVWDEPLSFTPERFLDSKLEFKGNDFEYIPFGAGRRICPGMALGARQVPLVLATLVHLFDWSLPDNMDSAPNRHGGVYFIKNYGLCDHEDVAQTSTYFTDWK